MGTGLHSALGVREGFSEDELEIARSEDNRKKPRGIH